MADTLPAKPNGTEHVLAHEGVSLMHVHGLQRSEERWFERFG